jgi:DNA-binding response OmpR family regulator
MPDQKFVLCVEDEPDIGWLIDRALDDLPVDFILENNGVDALEQMSERQPDLIILDLMLPRVSGWDFLDQVRANDKWGQIPVIVLTVRSGREDRKRGEELGVAHYMTKPFMLGRLQQVVRELLDLEESDR